jgi:hypothetical protein
MKTQRACAASRSSLRDYCIVQSSPRKNSFGGTLISQRATKA